DTSDDSDAQTEEDARSVIAVSISQAQTRLTSPNTPSAEKAAAMEDLDGAGFPPAPEMMAKSSPVPTAEPSKERLPVSDQGFSKRLPSPWRAGPKVFQRSEDTKNALRESLGSIGHRRRASSGGLLSAPDSVKKLLQFNLPSLPKSPSLLNFSFPGLSYGGPTSEATSAPTLNRSKRASTGSAIPSGQAKTASNKGGSPVVARDLRPTAVLEGDSPSDRAAGSRPTPHREKSAKSPLLPVPPGGPLGTHNHGNLRRSASDDSLLFHRSLSRASSLGDDSRFEHVQEQVNSRLKAIKDSFQDANFKIPAMPSMPNFGFGSTSSFKSGVGDRISHSVRYPSSVSQSPLKSSSQAFSTTARNKAVPGRGPMTADDRLASVTAGMAPKNTVAYPYFTRAIENLTGDVVVLGGYRGSVLRSAEPPHRQLWVPIKVGLNLRKVDLEVGLTDEDEETMEQRIIPGGMLTHIGPVDIARRLLKRLRASDNARTGKLRVHNYGYDWRLSPHLLSRQLRDFLAKLPCNRPDLPKERRGATVIAHSLGGLITRHVVNEQPDLFAGVIYAGVPQTCVNILGPLRNGDDVLISSRVLTAQVNFTIRTSFALLPLDGKCFFNKHTKEEYPVDFFDPQTWVDYRLTPCLAPPLPPLNSPNGTNSSPSITGIMSSMASALPTIQGLSRKGSISKGNTQPSPTTRTSPPRSPAARSPAAEASTSKSHAAAHAAAGTVAPTGMVPQMAEGSDVKPTTADVTASSPTTPNTTLPYAAALEYLGRTLAATKRFKQELAFEPRHHAANAYPAAAVIYGKSTPTVYGAKVASREAIARADAYDELAFASGDGVVLARAAMLPDGYPVVRGGVVSSDRGHVSLLGDLEAVGRAVEAVLAARNAGVGLGAG
ncbi:hypothetical protein BDY21DRAFT_266995, partial [Lineolata rhizophorae]